MRQRLYLDTSVFGGLFDDEFEEFTKPLFERILSGEFIILFSTVTQDELSNAPLRIQDMVKKLKIENTEFLLENDEAVELATQYIGEKVVGQTSHVDCLHIALANINRADLLISWNFKHIVNVERIRGYNSINMKFGYKPLEIRSPRDLMNYENEN